MRAITPFFGEITWKWTFSWIRFTFQ